MRRAVDSSCRFVVVMFSFLLGMGGVTAVAAPAVQAGGVPETVRAKETNQRVEVSALTESNRLVYANPDGTFSVEQAAVPVRGRTATGWAPIDTTLQERADGSVGPAVPAVPLTFSGGGRTDAVRYGGDSANLGLTWQAALPKPVLKGDTATYPDVLPGVDLALTATRSGFSHVFVVKSAEAGAQPALASLRFGVRTKGLAVLPAYAGGARVVDEAGAVVFQSAAAKMWDSAPQATSNGGTGGAGGQRQEATLPVTVDKDSISFTPDHGILANPRTRFPVFIDPDYSPGLNGWGMTYLEHPDDHYWLGDGSGFAKSGFTNWDVPQVTVRSFFQFDIGFLRGKHVLRSEFNILENWAPRCTPQEVQLWYTQGIDPGLSWRNQPGAIRLQDRRTVAFGRPGCDANFVGFDTGTAVAESVGAGSGTSTFMIRAMDEGNGDAWKKFDPNTATLIVTYNSLPSVPTGLSAENLGCGTSPSQPYTGTSTPRLEAKVSDPDGTPVSAKFEWWNTSGKLIGSTTTVAQASGTPYRVTVPAKAFGDGQTVRWRVSGWDGVDWGGWSNWCEITVDQTHPDKPPTVSSTDYPENERGGAVGKTGTFTLDANGVADVARFQYSFFGDFSVDPPGAPSRTSSVAAAKLGGSARALVTPPTDDPQVLYVRSLDRAGNPGPVRKYSFQVGEATPPNGQWLLDGAGTDITAPELRSQHPGTVTHNATGPTGAYWTPGRHGSAIAFDGATGSISTGGGPSVETGTSFSVSAWVRPDGFDGKWRAAVTQDGGNVSGFMLQYAPDTKQWAFALPNGDFLNPSWNRIRGGTPVAGVWTHLVGVFDAARKEIRLYVNGRLVATGAHTTPWNSSGAVQIGRGKYNTLPSDYWLGGVDDVRVYGRVLSDRRVSPTDEVVPGSELHLLATAPAEREGWWRFEESGGDAVEDSGNYRTATVSGSVGRAAGAVGAQAAEFDGSGGALTTSAPVVRTNTSYTVSARVKLEAIDGKTRTAVSQAGAVRNGFTLGVDGVTGKWSFSLPTGDTASATSVTVLSAVPARPGTWAQLTGVYDEASGQVRLYVDGARVGVAAGRVPWNATGPLRIGKGASDFWRGQIDDVQVHNGARTESQVQAEFADPATGPVPVYRGQLSRWLGHDSEHFTADGPVPPGYRFEASLGMLAPAGTAGAVPLYSCLLDEHDEFSSIDPGCEGKRRLAEVGSIYSSAPEGLPSQPVYRCLVGPRNEHFDSNDSACEGAKPEAFLGYTIAYQYLTRYVDNLYYGDHQSTSVYAPHGYQVESPFGLVARNYQPGTVSLMQCAAGEDLFTSTQADCEGAKVVYWMGQLWSAPPPDVASRELFRCKVVATGDRFDSIDSACEGQIVDRSLGYVISGL